MTAKYPVNSTVYLRSSAVAGFIEQATVVSIIDNGSLSYQVRFGAPSSIGIGVQDFRGRRSIVSGTPIYFTESELIDHKEALLIIESSLLNQYNSVVTLRKRLYP